MRQNLAILKGSLDQNTLTENIGMGVTQYKPAESLRRYIDAYYTIHRDAHYIPAVSHIFPDGCSDLFANLGNTTPYINNSIPLRPGHLYLGGTMANCMTVTTLPRSAFVGIRFKPGGLNVFYRLPILDLVDDVVDFPDPELMPLLDLDRGVMDRLNQFFVRRLSRARDDIFRLTGAVYQVKGRITVDDLAKKYFVSNRTLERLFKFNIGINPKEFIRIVRFQEVLKRLQGEPSRESLLRIAYETGYYDHAHLTNDFKRYSGLNPTDILPTGS